MNNEKKHLPLCIALCIAAVILGAAMFFFEMYLSYFSTANKTMALKWNETKVLVISVSEKPEKEVSKLIDFPYFGKVTYLTRYNYSAYGKRINGGGN